MSIKSRFSLRDRTRPSTHECCLAIDRDVPTSNERCCVLEKHGRLLDDSAIVTLLDDVTTAKQMTTK